MTECNAIIEANNEIDKLKRENKKLNELCVQYGFDMGRLEEENEQLKQTIETQNFNYDNAKSIIHDSEKQIRNLKDKNEQLKEETILFKRELDDASKLLNELTIPELLELVKSLNEENQVLKKENEQLKLLIAFIKHMKKCDCKSCPVDEYIQKGICE